MTIPSKEYQRAWRAAHIEREREKERERSHRYRLSHPRKLSNAELDKNAERRARVLGVFVAPVSRVAIYERDHGRCGICHEPIAQDAIEIDHIIPFARGGTHEPSNVQLAHRSCNQHKMLNADPGHCKNGHPFDLFNTVVRKDGLRNCRICQRERHVAWQRKRRQEARYRGKAP